MGNPRRPHRPRKEDELPAPAPTSLVCYEAVHLGTFFYLVGESTRQYYEEFINSFVKCSRNVSSRKLVSQIDKNLENDRENRLLLESIESSGKFKYFDIQFSLEDGISACCRFRASNLYLIAFKPGTHDSKEESWSCLKRWNNNRNVTKMDHMHEAPIALTYGDLEAYLNHRKNMPIGKYSL